MPDPEFHNFTWENGQYLLSTEKRWVNIDQLRQAWASPLCYWAKPLPPKAMKKMVENSLCFALVHFPVSGDWEMVGFARIITDYATICYLTDVYVLEEHQGNGLGKWMISCIPELLDGMPDLRGLLLLTSKDGKGVKFYEEALEMRDLSDSFAVLNRKGRGHVV